MSLPSIPPPEASSSFAAKPAHRSALPFAERKEGSGGLEQQQSSVTFSSSSNKSGSDGKNITVAPPPSTLTLSAPSTVLSLERTYPSQPSAPQNNNDGVQKIGGRGRTKTKLPRPSAAAAAVGGLGAPGANAGQSVAAVAAAMAANVAALNAVAAAVAKQQQAANNNNTNNAANNNSGNKNNNVSAAAAAAAAVAALGGGYGPAQFLQQLQQQQQQQLQQLQQVDAAANLPHMALFAPLISSAASAAGIMLANSNNNNNNIIPPNINANNNNAAVFNNGALAFPFAGPIPGFPIVPQVAQTFVSRAEAVKFCRDFEASRNKALVEAPSSGGHYVVLVCSGKCGVKYVLRRSRAKDNKTWFVSRCFIEHIDCGAQLKVSMKQLLDNPEMVDLIKNNTHIPSKALSIALGAQVSPWVVNRAKKRVHELDSERQERDAAQRTSKELSEAIAAVVPPPPFALRSGSGSETGSSGEDEKGGKGRNGEDDDGDDDGYVDISTLLGDKFHSINNNNNNNGNNNNKGIGNAKDRLILGKPLQSTRESNVAVVAAAAAAASAAAVNSKNTMHIFRGESSNSNGSNNSNKDKAAQQPKNVAHKHKRDPLLLSAVNSSNNSSDNSISSSSQGQPLPSVISLAASSSSSSTQNQTPKEGNGIRVNLTSAKVKVNINNNTNDNNSKSNGTPSLEENNNNNNKDKNGEMNSDVVQPRAKRARQSKVSRFSPSLALSLASTTDVGTCHNPANAEEFVETEIDTGDKINNNDNNNNKRKKSGGMSSNNNNNNYANSNTNNMQIDQENPTQYNYAVNTNLDINSGYNQIAPTSSSYYLPLSLSDGFNPDASILLGEREWDGK